MSRTSRTQETRAAQSRPVFTGSDAVLDLDVSGLPVNLVPKWVRETCRGEYDRNNISRNMREGYRPVLAKDLPGYESYRLPGAPVDDKQDGDELVRRDGMVLMARERRIEQQYRQALAAEHADTIRSVARETSAPKDGHNFKDLAPEVSVTTDRSAGRFAE